MPRRRKRVSSSLLLSLLVCMFITALILESAFGFFSLLAMGLKPFWGIPGFEGAKCKFVGAVPLGWPNDWQGVGEYHPLGRGSVIVQHESYGSWDKVYFMNSDPYNTLIAWDYHELGREGEDQIKMLIETQRDVALENLNYMGDPIDWNETQQLEVIQYQPLGPEYRQLEKTVVGNEVHYNLTKVSILLVPAEIHIAISIPPSHGNSYHWSGWQEGDWEEIELWFELDFTTWNTLAEPYASADQLSEWEASYFKTNPAHEYNLQSYYNLKGGFPVAGWVQGYLENVGPSWPQDYDDEIWTIVKSDEGIKYHITEASKATLDAKTQTLPELTGRAIALFSNPADPTEAYKGDYKGFKVILENSKTLYPWIPAQCPAYFPITVSSLGTVAEAHGPLGPWDVYYPAVNYRIRVIYAVYGTFTYLWTVQTAEDNGYPGWETREYEWVHVPNPWWDLISGLFSNPIFLFLLSAFLILAILLIIAIFAPGVFYAISAMGKRVGKSIEPKPSRRKRPG